MNRPKLSLFRRFKRAWFKHVLLRTRVPYALWHRCVRAAPVLLELDHREEHRLRQLTGAFLHEKSIVPAAGLELSDAMRVTIAAQACLLVLDLGLDYFDGWHEVIVYPHTFAVHRQERDAAGVVHETDRALVGESWLRGPVVLSWASIVSGASGHESSSNVVLHEFAHKLDMLNGAADGFPPLHPDMKLHDWTDAFTEAFRQLKGNTEHHRAGGIDPYGATNPGEFFAVVSEVFFQQPAKLHRIFPRVYSELCHFYRQDPLQRIRHKKRALGIEE